MKSLLRTSIYVLLNCVLILSCKDEGDDKIRFEGIVLTDSNGESLGTLGSRDLNDWGYESRLPTEIFKLMDDGIVRDLSDTDYSVIEIKSYPNPCTTVGKVIFTLYNGKCEVKILVVNEDFKVLYRSAYVGGSSEYTFDFSDPIRFPDQSIVRVYYSFSQKDDKNFYVGHGDILICRSGNCL